jgi:hypothetical protein
MPPKHSKQPEDDEIVRPGPPGEPALPLGPGPALGLGPLVRHPPLDAEELDAVMPQNFSDTQSDPDPSDNLVSKVQRETGIDGGVVTVPLGTLAAGGSVELPLSAVLRSVPGHDAEELGQVRGGTVVVILEGPQPHAGAAWWRVRTPDGRVGWAEL